MPVKRDQGDFEMENMAWWMLSKKVVYHPEDNTVLWAFFHSSFFHQRNFICKGHTWGIKIHPPQRAIALLNRSFYEVYKVYFPSWASFYFLVSWEQ